MSFKRRLEIPLKNKSLRMEKPKAALVDSEGERHFLYDDKVIIGRGQTSDKAGETYILTLKDPSISRKQCVINRNPDNTFTICDMSTRGTFLNNKPLVKKKPTPINHKDKISLLPSGVFSFTFWINKAWEIPKSEAHHDLTYYLTEQVLPLEKSYREEVKRLDEQLAEMKKVQAIQEDEKEEELRKKRDSYNNLLSDIRKEKTDLEKKLHELEDQNHLREAELREAESRISNLTEVNQDLESKLQERELALIQKEQALKLQEVALSAKAAAEENFKKEIKGLEEHLQCSICVELYIEPMMLNCGHMFCKTCLNEWKKKQKMCPVCRTKISQSVRTFHLDAIIEKNVALLTSEAQRLREEIIEERSTPAKKGKNKRKRNGEPVPQTLTAAVPSTVVPQPASSNIPTVTVTAPSLATVPTVSLETFTIPDVLNQPTGSGASTSLQLDPFAFTQRAQRRRLRADDTRADTPVPVAAIDLTSLPAPSTPNHRLPGFIDLTTP